MVAVCGLQAGVGLQLCKRKDFLLGSAPLLRKLPGCQSTKRGGWASKRGSTTWVPTPMARAPFTPSTLLFALSSGQVQTHPNSVANPTPRPENEDKLCSSGVCSHLRSSWGLRPLLPRLYLAIAVNQGGSGRAPSLWPLLGGPITPGPARDTGQTGLSPAGGSVVILGHPDNHSPACDLRGILSPWREGKWQLYSQVEDVGFPAKCQRERLVLPFCHFKGARAPLDNA